jgi:hypothetical protein
MTAKSDNLGVLVFRAMNEPSLSWPIELIRRAGRPLTPAAQLLAEELLAQKPA